jgi:hypothetical protein
MNGVHGFQRTAKENGKAGYGKSDGNYSSAEWLVVGGDGIM